MKARSLSRSPSPTRSESPYGRRQSSRSPSYSSGDTRHRKVNNSRSPSRSPSVNNSRSPSRSRSSRRYRSRSPSRSRSSRRYRSRRSPSYSRSSRSCSRSPSPLPRRKRDRSPSYSHSPRRSYSPRHRRTYGGRHRSQTPRRRRRECRSRSYSSCSRSPSYSPRHRRRYSYRSPTPRKGRKGYSHRDSATSLLIRNLSRDCGTGDLRRAFEEFGPIKDVYIPRDYYTSEPRGFGFVQFVYPQDADDAQYYMNRCIIYGREIIVVFAEENRKTPNEMRTRDRKRHPSSGYDSIRRSPSSDSLNSGPARSRSSSPTQQR